MGDASVNAVRAEFELIEPRLSRLENVEPLDWDDEKKYRIPVRRDSEIVWLLLALPRCWWHLWLTDFIHRLYRCRLSSGLRLEPNPHSTSTRHVVVAQLVERR